MGPSATIRSKKQELEAKRQQVREAYAQFGFPSAEYAKEFDELHELGMRLMAAQYREERGMHAKAETPYCA